MADPQPTDPIIPVPVPIAPKPGYKTTEFWLSALTSVIGFLLASGIVKPGTPWDKAIGFITMALSGMGYTVGRSMVKAAILKMCLALAMLPLLSGCGLLGGNNGNLTPLARSVQARELYISTMHVLTDARAAGKITDDQARTIEVIRAEVAGKLDLWESAAAGENTVSANQYAAIVNDLLDKLLAWRAMVEAKK